ncbi:hypothetical protein KUM39_24770 [Streptomyces sp. J2-1]|uniref:protealysin inhibitor emfourin n=1 Tax=Streptomyces corallincola TaxID=2851888 RepID=UPI001C38EB1E|nr:protealysin inhibitor emfourin [Streptomyces corallincola]MBV2357541.1 hypothetical protein [Streptomyces corallincola]
MRIRVRRTGGFAGVERAAGVDTAGRADAARWHALAAGALAAADTAPPTGVPDGFHYTITVDDRTVYAADPHVADPVRELVTRLLKEGA